MKIKRQWSFTDSIILAEVDEIPADTLKALVRAHMMHEAPALPWQEHLDPSTNEKLKALKARYQDHYTLKIVALENNEIIGWSHGWQDLLDHGSFFMASSLVIPEKRRAGLYTALANKVLEIIREEGFQSAWSLHLMTNNPVIIAKMRLDFSIVGFEVHTVYGPLVKLNLHFSELRNQTMRYRAGVVGESEVHSLLVKRTTS